MEPRQTRSKMARAFVAGALALSSLMVATPVPAHIVEVTTALDIPDAQDAAAVKAALHDAVKRVIAETIAFKPTMVALTDARVMGEKVLVRLLLADADGERMLKDIQDGGSGSASPDEDESAPRELKI
jgi:hypothetical protein